MFDKYKIGISFFIKDGEFDKRAIGKGVYAIKLRNKINNESILLYIGESVRMVVRGAEHLYTLFQEPKYMGLLLEDLSNENLELIFEFLEYAEEEELFDKEKELIEEMNPLTQSRTSDRQLKNKLSIVQDEIKKLLS